MKREDQRQQRRIVTFALLSFILLAAFVPLFLSVDPVENILRGSAVKAADQASYTLSRPIHLAKIPGLAVRSGTLSLAGAPKAAPIGSRSRVQLLESGRGVLILHRPQLVISSDPDKQRHPAPEAPFAKALADMNFRALIIEAGDLTIESDSGPSIVIKDLDLRLRPVAGGRMIAKGSFEFVGRKLRFDTTIGLSDAVLASQKIPVRGTIDAGNLLTASINGHFQVGSGGRLNSGSTHVEVKDVAILARWLGLSWPSELGLKSFKASGQMEWIGHVLNFPSGEFSLDDNSATGSLLLNTKGERPLIDGTLAFKSFDWSALVAKAENADAPETEKTVGADNPNKLSASFKRLLHHFRLPILQQIDFDLRVSSGSTVLGDLSIGKTAAAISLHKGRILVDLADIEFSGTGRGNLQFTADTNRAVMHCTLRGNLEQLPVETLTGLLLPRQLLKGPARVSLDLNGGWALNDEFLRGLNGRAAIRMEEGALLYADLPGLVQSIGIDKPAQLGWGTAGDAETPLDLLNAVVQFKNGIANFHQLQADRRGYYSASASGSLNIFGKSLDLNIIPTFERADPQPASVLNINGHWDNPILVRRRYPHQAERPGAAPASKSPPAARPIRATNRS